MDLALYNLQRLICYEIQKNKQTYLDNKCLGWWRVCKQNLPNYLPLAEGGTDGFMPLTLLINIRNKSLCIMSVCSLIFHIIILKSICLHAFPWFSLATRPYWSSFLASPLLIIQFPHWGDYVNFCWSTNTSVSVCRSSQENIVCPYKTINTQDILLILLEWFVKWDIGGRKAVVLRGAASRIR